MFLEPRTSNKKGKVQAEGVREEGAEEGFGEALIHPSIRLFTPKSASRQLHNPSQSQFSTQCDLALPLPISIILSFSEGRSVAAYIFFLVFPSLLSFPIFPSTMCFRRHFPSNM